MREDQGLIMLRPWIMTHHAESPCQLALPVLEASIFGISIFGCPHPRVITTPALHHGSLSMPRFRGSTTASTVPRGFSDYPIQLGNQRPDEAIYIVDRVHRVTALAQDGVFSFCWQAHNPSFSYNSGTAGMAFQPGSQTNAFALPSPNPNVATAFTNYSHGVVVQSDITADIIPSPENETSVELGRTARWYLTLSDSENAHGGDAPTIIASRNAGTLDKMRQTVIGRTEAIPQGQGGGRNRGIRLSGTYTPRRVYFIKDVRDHLDDFGFQTEYSASTDPVVTNGAFWTITGSYDHAIRQDGFDGTNPVYTEPMIVPHVIEIRVRYTVLMYDAGTSKNAPVGPDARFGGMFEGADASSFERAGMSILADMASRH